MRTGKMTGKMNVADFTGLDRKECIVCGTGTAVRAMQHQEFEYGTGAGATMLHAYVPVWSCEDCGLEYVDEEGEIAQHAAVCRHLGRLAPGEVHAVRITAGLTQQAFAEQIAVGVASIKRWESGSIVQNASADAAIRNFQKKWRQEKRPEPVFRTALSAQTIAASGQFRLRLPSTRRATT